MSSSPRLSRSSAGNPNDSTTALTRVMTPGVSFDVAARRAFSAGEKTSPTDFSMMARR